PRRAAADAAEPDHGPGRHRRLRHLAGTREIRPIPRELRRLPEVVGTRALLSVALGLFVLTLPAWLSTSRINLATIILIFGIVAASLVVLTGWAGQVSLGQMAFVGIGAAVGGALTDHRGWDLALAGALAGLAGAGAARGGGYPSPRGGRGGRLSGPAAGRADARREHVGLRPVRVAIRAQPHHLPRLATGPAHRPRHHPRDRADQRNGHVLCLAGGAGPGAGHGGGPAAVAHRPGPHCHPRH